MGDEKNNQIEQIQEESEDSDEYDDDDNEGDEQLEDNDKYEQDQQNEIQQNSQEDQQNRPRFSSYSYQQNTDNKSKQRTMSLNDILNEQQSDSEDEQQMPPQLLQKISQKSTESFSVMEEKPQLKNMNSSESFSILDDKSQSFGIFELNKKADSFSIMEPSYDKLTQEFYQHDQTDEWLKMNKQLSDLNSDSRSRIEIDSFSEYSSMDYHNSQVQLIQTKTDIFVQDEGMQKIIKYVGYFSADCRKSLQQFRSGPALLINQKYEENQRDIDDDFINLQIDIDHIDKETIYLILDVLESFKLYKLCIFVCNRYHLSNRLGRYVVSIAYKYGIMNINQGNTYFSIQPKPQVLENSLMSHLALHSVFENINPAFLRQGINEDDGLGLECFKGLIQLGFWKKCVFFLDPTNSQQLTSTFADFKNNKIMYLNQNNIQYNQASCDVPGFEFLPFKEVDQSNIQQTEICMIALEHFIWFNTDKFGQFVNNVSLSKSNNIKLNTKVFLKNIYIYSSKCQQNLLIISNYYKQIPQFYPYNKSLWEYMENQNNEKLDILIKQFQQSIFLMEKIISGNISSLTVLEMFDIMTFFFLAVVIMKEFVGMFESQHAALIARICQLKFLQRTQSASKYQQLLIRALLVCFRCRCIGETRVLENFGKSFVMVHRSSIVFQELINMQHQENSKKLKQSDAQQFNVKNEYMIPADLDQYLFLAQFERVLMILKEKMVLLVLMIKVSAFSHSYFGYWRNYLNKNTVLYHELDYYNTEQSKQITIDAMNYLSMLQISNHDEKIQKQPQFDLIRNYMIAKNFKLDINQLEKQGISMIQQLIIKEFLKRTYLIQVCVESDDEYYIYGLSSIVEFYYIMQNFGSTHIVQEMMRHSLFPKFISFQSLIDAHYYIQYGMVEEYLDQFFAFLQKTISQINILLILKLLQECLVFMLITKTKIYLTSHQKEILDLSISYNKEIQQEWYDEWLFYVNKGLKKLTDFMELENLIKYQIIIHKFLILLLTFLKNHENISQKEFVVFQKNFQLLKPQQFKKIFPNISDNLFEFFNKLTNTNSNKNISNQLSQHEQEYLNLVTLDQEEQSRYEEIVIISDKKQVSKNQLKSDSDYYQHQITLAKRIQAAKIINEFFFNFKNKLKSLIKQDKPILIHSVSSSYAYTNKINHIVAKQRIIRFLLKGNTQGFLELLQLQREMNWSLKNLSQISAIDFRFLVNQIDLIQDKIQDACYQIFQEDLENDHFLNLKQQVNAMIDDFNQWKIMNQNNQKDPKIYQKNQKKLELKYLKKGLYNKAQLLAQKMAAIKKKKYVKEQALLKQKRK